MKSNLLSAVLSLFALGTYAAAQTPLIVVGLTNDQRLIAFADNNPGAPVVIGAVAGLPAGDALVGIDYRPVNNELIGLSKMGGVYTLDPQTAVATFKSQVNTALLGTSFGIDFNPTVDRLRVVSDLGQNLRIDVTTGAATPDMALNYNPAAASGVTGVAYTNNDADPNTGTTLFDIDTVLDQIAIQSPPNNGVLVGTGKLGLDAGSDVGFDIYTRISNGVTVESVGFCSLKIGTETRFYRVALLSGRSTLRGTFPPALQVIDVALPLAQG